MGYYWLELFFFFPESSWGGRGEGVRGRIGFGNEGGGKTYS